MGLQRCQADMLALDFQRKLPIRGGSVGLLCKMGAFAWNLRFCLCGSPTDISFRCTPPELDSYLCLLANVAKTGGIREAITGENGSEGDGGRPGAWNAMDGAAGGSENSYQQEPSIGEDTCSVNAPETALCAFCQRRLRPVFRKPISTDG